MVFLLELSVNSKKELHIAESPIFESSKLLKISFGTPEKFDVRTYKKLLSRINLEDLNCFIDELESFCYA